MSSGFEEIVVIFCNLIVDNSRRKVYNRIIKMVIWRLLMNRDLFKYIEKSPTAYHACAESASVLADNGYTELYEGEAWDLCAGGKYFVRRNGSSLIAFRAPEKCENGFMITASHSDSPCLKIKDNSTLGDANYTRLSVEVYGGPIYSTWLDRPLAVAGRVSVETEKGIDVRLVDTKEPCVVIPNVAIHMNREINRGFNFNQAVDLIPLFGEKEPEKSFSAMIAELAGAKEEDILASDLYVYNCQAGVEWGGFISSPRLDDLQCAYSALEAFVGAKESKATPVYALFDNEEVGSSTKQGAASTFLYDVLERVADSIGKGGEVYRRAVANSFMVSCDNAHAIHPNHPEYSDKNHTVKMNGGIVIKYNANQKYTTDGISSAIFKRICERAGVPYQLYCNRADMPGGSTLGSIATTKVSVKTVDIGLAQLAMHSSFETAGAKDTEYMVKALKKFYESSLTQNCSGFEIK